MFFLIPAHPVSPRQKAVNGCVCVMSAELTLLVGWLVGWLDVRKGIWLLE